MRKTKIIINTLLAILVVAVLSAVSVSAKNISVQNLPSDTKNFIKMETYLSTHPKEAYSLTQELTKGNTEAVKQYFSDPDVQELTLRVSNLSGTLSDILKTAYITQSPNNSEKNIIPEIRITNSDQAQLIKNAQSSAPEFTFLNISNNLTNAFNVDPFLAYKNNKNELIVWGVLRNNTKKNAVVNAIPHIELFANGKLLASGNATPFETPMKMSPYQVKVNTGIYDGLPDKCFIKMVFEPGAYDGTADISNLDNLSCSYTLDYEPLQ